MGPDLFSKQTFLGDEVDRGSPNGARFDSPGRAPIRGELVALCMDQNKAHKPQRGEIPVWCSISSLMESRPYRAQAANHVSTQGSASLRPGLSNLAPMGLTQRMPECFRDTFRRLKRHRFAHVRRDLLTMCRSAKTRLETKDPFFCESFSCVSWLSPVRRHRMSSRMPRQSRKARSHGEED